MTSPDYRYKFYLRRAGDSAWTLVSNPDGWDEMVTVIKRDKDLKGLFATMEVTFVFQDDGYDFIRKDFIESDYCAEIEVLIEQSRDAGDSFVEFYNGIIKISDVEFDLKYRNAKTKVLDNSFFAKIYENKNLEAVVIAGKSKNAITIPIPSFHLLQLFEPQTGTYYPIQTGSGKERSNYAYTAYELLKYLVAFMSDGEVAFDSTLFGVGGEFENVHLTFGKVIRRTQAGISTSDFQKSFPVLTFQKLFTALNRRLNLGVYIDNSQGKPTLRVEKWDDLFKNNITAQIKDIDQIKERISTDDIYSQLKIGGNKTIENNAGALQGPNVRWIWFNSELYNIVGKCNVDRVLDLSDDFIVDSNVIEQILVNDTADDTYDKDWFIINAEFDSGNTWKAVQSNWIDPANTPPLFYNEIFINSNIALRFLKAVPNAIALELPLNDNTFRASSTSEKSFSTFQGNFICDPTGFCPVPYEDDSTPPNHDTNNNYDPITSLYTVPESGLYNFKLQSKIYTTAPKNIPISIQLRIRDSGGVILFTRALETGVSTNYIKYIDGGTRVSIKNSVSLTAGQTVEVIMFQSDAYFYTPVVFLKEGSTFEITQAVTGGGVFQTYDPADYPIIKDEFDTTSMEFDSYKFDVVKNDPLSLIEFSRAYIDFTKGWIDEMRFNHYKQEASFRLLSSKNSR